MKIFHVDRDFSMPLSAWKKKLEKKYVNIQLIQSEGRGKFMVIAEKKK